jgi:hypothetical protein
VLDTGLGLLRLAGGRKLRAVYPEFVVLLGNEAQTIAVRDKRSSSPKSADRFIRAIYREQSEGNAHIQDMISRLIYADVEEGEGRIRLQQDGGGWRMAA